MSKLKRKKTENAMNSFKQKGEVVERIVALMHEGDPPEAADGGS
jgi:hypothetical protein